MNEVQGTALEKQERFSIRKTMGYSSYNAAATMNGLLVTYLTYYATDSLYLTAAAIGMVMAFSRVFDGFTDIIAGALIDRTNTKIGRARPYLLCGALAYAAMMAMFSTPDLPDVGKMIWIFITYNLNTSIFATFYGVCGPSLLRRMVVKSENRVKLLAINGVFNSVASTAVNVVLPILVSKAGNNTKSWSLMAIGTGSVGILLTLIAFFLCKEYTPQELVEFGEMKEQDITEKKKITVKEMLLGVVKNKYFLIYLIAFFVNALYMGISYGVQVYYYSSNLGNLAVMSTVSMLLIITWPLNFVYTKIINKIGSTKFVQYFLILGAVGSLIRMYVGSNVIGLAVTSWMSGFVVAGISLIGTEITIQCMEYSKLKNGIEAESIYNSFLNFAMKVGMGVGSAVLGIALTAIGYDGTLAVQPQSALSGINFMFNVFPAICAAVMFVVMHFCKVEQANKELRGEA